MANVYTPDSPASTRKVHQTAGERKQANKDFKERKAHEAELKEERFKKIARKRSIRGAGINVKVS